MTSPLPHQIRPATVADGEALTTLWRRCRLTVPYNDPIADLDFARGKIASDVLVADVDGLVSASVMVGHDGHRGWLYYVAVSPELQKHGLGAAIVAAGERWLTERGVRKVMLMVRDTNTQAEGFYHAIGYTTEPRIVLSKWLTGGPECG
jgi:ribosomal protein S18 acetylase RimI-like enzyme